MPAFLDLVFHVIPQLQWGFKIVVAEQEREPSPASLPSLRSNGHPRKLARHCFKPTCSSKGRVRVFQQDFLSYIKTWKFRCHITCDLRHQEITWNYCLLVLSPVFSPLATAPSWVDFPSGKFYEGKPSANREPTSLHFKFNVSQPKWTENQQQWFGDTKNKLQRLLSSQN